MIDTAFTQLAEVTSTARACTLLGKARATHYRRQAPPRLGPPPPRPAPPNRLTEALLAVLKHFTSRACTGWTIVAVAALLAAMPGPFLGASNAAATAVLALMHVGIAAVLIPGLAAQPELVTAPLRPSDADSDDRLSIVERDASDRNIVRRWRHRVVRGHSP